MMSLPVRLMNGLMRMTTAGLLSVLTFAGGSVAAPGDPADSSFRLAEEGYRYEFPRDHGSHNDFRTEWWYYTGHLDTAEGRRFGF